MPYVAVIEGSLNGQMVSFDTWEKVIRASDGSKLMKEMLIHYVKMIRTEDGLLDSFELGLRLGWIGKQLAPGKETEDFLRTIEPTRSLDNVPIVRRDGETAS